MKGHGLRDLNVINKTKQNKGCLTLSPCHLHQKVSRSKMKNYGNSNISPCKNVIFKKSSKRNQNPSSCYYYNSMITNLKFQTQAKISSSKNPHVEIDLIT
jgi:hypothetical protein